ncbi:MAG: phasin family protein [Hyphomicrobiaceae bacterium]
MANNQLFEMPQQLRELAEKNVEQGRAAYVQCMDAMLQATSMWWGALPAHEASSGFRLVQDRCIHFAKQNTEAGFTLAGELANAKSVTDALAVQSRYANTQMLAYAEQFQDLRRLMVDAAQSTQQRSSAPRSNGAGLPEKGSSRQTQNYT